MAKDRTPERCSKTRDDGEKKLASILGLSLSLSLSRQEEFYRKSPAKKCDTARHSTKYHKVQMASNGCLRLVDDIRTLQLLSYNLFQHALHADMFLDLSRHRCPKY